MREIRDGGTNLTAEAPLPKILNTMEDLINPDFAFIDECETIADYIEEHIYDTIAWQLPIDLEDPNENYANEMHAGAMEQVVAILAARMLNRPGRELKLINTRKPRQQQKEKYAIT